MMNQGRPGDRIEAILAVSGGADSVYLLDLSLQKSRRLLVAHFNHGARGRESDADQRFLSSLCKDWGLSMEVGKAQPEATVFPLAGRKGKVRPRFEEKARETRYAFLKDLLVRHKAQKILVAHTADDQVETVLMRILEGAGVTGLKGIPRRTEDGIERPLLDTWREDILKYLKKNKIPYRDDKSNFDTRFERNWVRHVLLPLLEERYGKSVKKRIFTLGERFREIDVFIEQNARRWLTKNSIYLLEKRGVGTLNPAKDREERGKVRIGNFGRKTREEDPPAKEVAKEAVTIPRKVYAALPSLLRIRILQILCFERIGTAPNERLLASMDRLIVSGGPSARLSVGRGSTLRCRYGEAILTHPGPQEKKEAVAGKTVRTGQRKERKDRGGKVAGGKARETIHGRKPVVRMDGPGIYRWEGRNRANGAADTGHPGIFLWEERGKTAPGRIRRLAEGGNWAAFDGERLPHPLSVRPLRAGDRIRPFGLGSKKKVKEILIDRKVPREERWGRPVVCDANGEILWIPGVVRSAHAPVTPLTRRTIVLRAEIAEGTSS
jgi:tRNA(Ile)-lysidine synthetase-like protein